MKATTGLFLFLFLCASSSAQTGFKTLDYLYSISGTNILSGQHNDQKDFHGEATGASYWTDEVYEVTGKYPALWGGDLLFHGNSEMRWEMAYEAEKQWEKGAVINIMWHACPPNMTEPCDWEGGVLSALDEAEWTELLTEGGSLNTIWKSRMDEIAAPYLQFLEDKGVEVLWRPFHEQNQTLFWWNSGGAENTKALWKLTHDYMTNDLGLTNLIWSWDVQDIHSSYAQYNPGDAYFDMAAIDIYSDGYTNLEYYNALVEQADGKPVAFGECFKFPSASVMETQSEMSFFMIWAYGLYEDYNGTVTNTVQDILDAYNNPRVITLDEMPGWNSFCAFDGVLPSVPGLIEAENFGICGAGTSYADSDSVNVPGYYRDDTGVDIDTLEAGYFLTDIQVGEWTEYVIQVDTAGTYMLELALASNMEDRRFHLELDGSDISGLITVPNTGGLQDWDTISVMLEALDAGPGSLRLVMDSASFSIDFMEFIMGNKSPFGNISAPEDGAIIPEASDITLSVEAGDPDGTIALVEFFNGALKLGEVSAEPFDFLWEEVDLGDYSITARVTDNEGLSVVTDAVSIQVNTAQGPFLGEPHAIPGIIECEDYDLGGEGVSFHELSAGNKFLTTYHGNDPVDLEICEDEGGGFHVGDFQDGEWVNYTVEVATDGVFDMEIRCGTEMEGTSLSFSLDGQDLTGPVATPGTGGWQEFTTLLIGELALSQGEHVLTMHCVKGYQNINWLHFSESAMGFQDEEMADSEISQSFRVYPNPFRHSTSIAYYLAEQGQVELMIYDSMGKYQRTLVEEVQDAGYYQLSLDAGDLATGVYFIGLRTGTQFSQRKILLVE